MSLDALLEEEERDHEEEEDLERAGDGGHARHEAAGERLRLVLHRIHGALQLLAQVDGVGRGVLQINKKSSMTSSFDTLHSCDCTKFGLWDKIGTLICANLQYRIHATSLQVLSGGFGCGTRYGQG